MAIMKGELKLSDPKAFYDCLAYMGGMRASSAILLEYPVAQKVFDTYKSVVYDKKSISCVHHISWNVGHNKDKIIHCHFTNLKTAGDGFKIIDTEKVLP